MAQVEQRSRGSSRGAVSTGGGGAPAKKKGLAWLLAALALALLAALVLFLLARNAWDEGDAGGLDLTNDRTASGEAADDRSTDERSDGSGSPTTHAGATPTTDAGATPTTGADTPTPPAGDSPLTVGDRSLLPVPPAGGLGTFESEMAEATSITVESVVSDEGFWVGDSASQRVFVRLLTGGAESPVQIERGRRVSFTGTVTANPADVSTFGVDAAEGADLLTEQGQHIEVGLGDIRQG